MNLKSLKLNTSNKSLAITSSTGESAVITRLYLNFLCLPFSPKPIPFGTGDVGLGEFGALLNLGGRPLPLFTGNIVIFFILLGLKKNRPCFSYIISPLTS